MGASGERRCRRFADGVGDNELVMISKIGDSVPGNVR